MTVAPTAGAHTLEIHRTYAAPRERVFRAWTEADSLAKWFAPSDEYTILVHALETLPGGGYRIEMRHNSSGKSSVVYGVFLECLAPERLVFTWHWEADAAKRETLVTVTFNEHAGATELVLRHALFVDEANMLEHDKGWTGCLSRLPATL